MYTKQEFISKFENFIKQQKITGDYDICHCCPVNGSVDNHKSIAGRINESKYTHCCLSFLVYVSTYFPSKFNKIVWMLDEKIQSDGNFPEKESYMLLKCLKEAAAYEVE